MRLLETDQTGLASLAAESALKQYGRMRNRGEACFIVKRADHPHIAGDYFYCSKPQDKTAWTAGETVLTDDEIAALWYALECPPC